LATDDAHDLGKVLVRKVWREFHKQRRPLGKRVACGLHPLQQGIEGFWGLEIAQARRVGGRDIEREVVRDRYHALHATDIVGNPILAIAPCPDIDANNALRPIHQPGERYLLALVVESEPVDDGAVRGRAK